MIVNVSKQTQMMNEPPPMKSAHRLRAAPTKTADIGTLLSLHLLSPFTAGYRAWAALLASGADFIEGQTA